MGVSLTVEERCAVAEVAAAYRRERDAVRRSYLQVIWLLLDGLAAAEVSRVTGFGVRWVEKLTHRWNADGFAGLGDRRHGNAGQKPVLDAAGQAARSSTRLLYGTWEPVAPMRRERSQAEKTAPNDLVSKGYNYWALGHVHQAAALHERPHVVVPDSDTANRRLGSKAAVRSAAPKGLLWGHKMSLNL